MSLGQRLNEKFGKEVEDAHEEMFLLFACQLPSSNLGFVDPTATEIEIEVAGRDFTITQSPGLLTSSRSGGTTGAVLWKITPLIAKWITTSTVLRELAVLHPVANVVELGCGISGLVGLSLSQHTSSYIQTDQEYVMRFLHENIAMNSPQSSKPSKHSSKQKNTASSVGRLLTLTLDWEKDDARNVQTVLGPDQRIDLVLACDCIYNEFLVHPLVDMSADLCALNLVGERTLVLFAQQLRSQPTFQHWLEYTCRRFHVWRVPDQYLLDELKEGKGYVVHVAVLR